MRWSEVGNTQDGSRLYPEKPLLGVGDPLDMVKAEDQRRWKREEM